MCKNIICLDCNREYAHLAEGYGQQFKPIIGQARVKFICSSCHKQIEKGEFCSAGVLRTRYARIT